MIKDIQLRVTLHEEKQTDILTRKSADFLGIPTDDISGIKVLRKSIDHGMQNLRCQTSRSWIEFGTAVSLRELPIVLKVGGRRENRYRSLGLA